MPTPTITNVQRIAGNDLASALSEYTFPGAITSIDAAWRRVPDYTADDLGVVKVSVTPGPYEINQQDQPPRGADFFNPVLGIVIAKSVSNDTEIDDLDELVQGIVDAIRSYKVTLASFAGSSDWRDITVPVPFDRESLNERSVFLAEINVTWMIGVDKLAAT
jgi:hypothetical protein